MPWMIDVGYNTINDDYEREYFLWWIEECETFVFGCC